MVDWKYLLFAQYPAFYLLAFLFLINYLFVRRSSAVKSIVWVLLFGVALAGAALCAFLGVQQGYWTLGTFFPLGAASWIGIVIVAAALAVHVIHIAERKHNRRVMEKELKKAEKVKDDALAQARKEGAEAARRAHEEGRAAARQEAETMRLSKAAADAEAEAAASEGARAAEAPIELTLDAPPDAPPREG